MDDVARECGYSRATVSLALRGNRTIPEETRNKIAATADRLGYRTNPLVAALMSMQRKHRPVTAITSEIAYLTTHPADNPWHKRKAYVDMHRGAVGRAAELGFRLEEFNLRSEGMTPARMRKILQARSIHALVVAPLPRGETEVDFDFSALAVTGVGMSVREPLIERVASDHFQSAVLAVNRCLALGYRRIGLALNHEGSLRLEHRWYGGYQVAMAESKLKVRIPPLMPPRLEDFVSVVPAWLRKFRPDVVIFDSVEPELWALLPDTVGVVDLSLDHADGAVTGIFQNSAQIGRVAVEHAVARLNTNSFDLLREAHMHLVAGSWVAGGTAPGPGRRRLARTEKLPA